MQVSLAKQVEPDGHAVPSAQRSEQYPPVQPYWASVMQNPDSQPALLLQDAPARPGKAGSMHVAVVEPLST